MTRMLMVPSSIVEFLLTWNRVHTPSEFDYPKPLNFDAEFDPISMVPSETSRAMNDEILQAMDGLQGDQQTLLESIDLLATIHPSTTQPNNLIAPNPPAVTGRGRPSQNPPRRRGNPNVAHFCPHDGCSRSQGGDGGGFKRRDNLKTASSTHAS